MQTEKEEGAPLTGGPVDRSVRPRSADCYREDGQPVKCFKCGSEDIREKTRAMLNVYYGQGPVMEFECVCGACGESVGYWAHGYYDPGYMTPNAELSGDHRESAGVTG